MKSEVIIAGCGVAGAAAAAALAQSGYDVLVVDPLLDHAKRLAGELIHPRGVADLRSLGLLGSLRPTDAVPVFGFTVFAGERPSRSGTHVLPYSANPGLDNSGLAVEHGILTEAVLNAIEKVPNISVWKGSRVTAIDLSARGFVDVTVTHEGTERRLRAQLLVAADGRCSHVRRMAGIRETQIHISNMSGYLLPGNVLPQPGFGHVFADGPGPVLAYSISADKTRMMFDLPRHSSRTTGDPLTAYLRALPDRLRNHVKQSIDSGTPLHCANYSVTPETVTRGRLVCVGDAGGCCHPISASGLSTCARDAILLQQTLKEAGGDIPHALRSYADGRAQRHRTRMLVAQSLFDVLKAETLEAGLMRKALLHYWRDSPNGRISTMALLSTCESRPSAFIREYLKICRHALPELMQLESRGNAAVALSRSVVRLLGQALLGYSGTAA